LPFLAIDGRLQEECGVGLASLNAMLVIDATPLCRVHDIARAVAITVGGASQAVDRLESAGRCARRANPSDRRSSIVELTPEGAELLAIAAPVFDRELDRLLRTPLPGTALTHLADALSALRRSAAAQADSPAAGGAFPPGKPGRRLPG
jgi:DNA-binding MarR family transcriptional regulator